MIHAINIKDTDRILIVAPHADDETIGMGGFLILYGKQCDVLLLTDGRKGKSSRYEDNIVEVRLDEFKHVTEKCRVRKTYYLGIEDSTVNAHIPKIKRFSVKEYDYIFVPNRYEIHRDHRPCYKAFKHMIISQHSRAHLYEYEVWSPLPQPNQFLDVTEIFTQKKELMNLYPSQLDYFNYNDLFKSLNRYRGLIQKVGYCEAYFSEKLYIREKWAIYFERMPNSFKSIARWIKRKFCCKSD